MTSVLGFKARVDQSLACFVACNGFLRFISGATPADLLTASMARFRTGVLQHSKQTRYPLSPGQNVMQLSEKIDQIIG